MIYLLTIATLAFVFYQDVKTRSIYWFLPVTIGVLIYFTFPIAPFWNDILVNLGFLFLLFSSLTFYLSLKNKAFVNPFKNYFGLGDLLFLVALVTIGHPVFFMMLFISGTLFSLLLSITFIDLTKKNIPYAGFFSLFLIGVILTSKIYPPFYYELISFSY